MKTPEQDIQSAPGVDIDLPGLKEILWHRMRSDLENYMPNIASTRLLMCPACCRFLPIENFDIEHIIPVQSLTDDPPGLRDRFPKNQRTPTILLCTKELLIKGKRIHPLGCNSWKGRFYDRFLREIFNSTAVERNQFTSRHSAALFSACFLGLFEKYGYQIPLMQSGLLMRMQFFNPNGFVKLLPPKFQMILMGRQPLDYSSTDDLYWFPPFKFVFERGSCIAIVRNASIYLPVSRNPEVPIAKTLRYTPPRYALRPNFNTVFD